MTPGFVLLCCAALPLSPMPSPRAAHASMAHHVAAAATVYGTITMPAAGKRVANRYAGTGSGAAQTVQQIPGVVFLRGEGVRGKTAPRRERMAQRDTAFAPNLLVIPTGSTVRFPNDDSFFHNVFSYSKSKRFDLGRFASPEYKDLVFDQTGLINVFCEIHKSMRAVIMVVDNPDYHVQVGADGRYSIANVPAGSYELVIWHADHGTKTLKIQVPESGSLKVDAAF